MLRGVLGYAASGSSRLRFAADLANYPRAFVGNPAALLVAGADRGSFSN